MSTYFIIAAGPSYKNITEEEWMYLENKHTITFTRVPYGGRKTEYYLSIERDYIDKSVLTYMAKLGYLDTKLLLYIPESIALAKELGFKHIRKIFKQNFYFMPSRKPWFIDESEPPHKFIECRAKNFHQPLFRFRGQLTAVINSCLILGATEIRLIGVDLNSQKNFYQDYDYLRQVCRDSDLVNTYIEFDSNTHSIGIKEFKEKYSDFNPDLMHTTNIPITEKRWNGKRLRGVADVLEWIDKSMREEGIEGMFTTNKESLLYKENKLKYKSITG